MATPIEIQTSLGVYPAHAQQVSARLVIQQDADRLIAYVGGDPVYVCGRSDRLGRRVMAAELSRLGLARVGVLAEALGVSREFIRRNRNLLAREGIEGFTRPRRSGRRRAYKLTGSTRATVQRRLNAGWSMRRAAAEVGLSEGTIRHAVSQGQLHRATPEDKAVSTPQQRAAEDHACPGGVAVKRMVERIPAAMASVPEAEPQFSGAASVVGAGALLALPGVLEQGLLDIGQRVLAPLSPGFYGLRSLLLTLVVMALLRIKSVEQLSSWAPGELGLLLGLDRAPEVKTVRRKLAELGRQRRSVRWQRALAEYWVEQSPDAVGWLYIDGHVRVYHGRAQRLPKQHAARLGRLVPGTQDFHVMDAQAQPLFYVTAEATESLLEMMEHELLPEIRRLVPPDQRLLLVFDRAGWSPHSFQRWRREGCDVLTYRKGPYTPWPEEEFKEQTAKREGRRVTYRLAERSATLPGSLAVREIRRLTATGHQTAIITTCTQGSPLELAWRLFGRWRQENFFRYMRQAYALDHLGTAAVEPASGDRLVSNPERKQLDQPWRACRAERDRFNGYRLDVEKVGGTVREGTKTWTEDELIEATLAAQERMEELDVQRRQVPARVPLRQVRAPEDIVRLEPERKRLTDIIKTVAYRAESVLARHIEPFFARHEDEARRFLHQVFQATADLIPDETAHTLTVRFHGLANPRAMRALHALCDIVNDQAVSYPGSNLILRFEAPHGHIP